MYLWGSVIWQKPIVVWDLGESQTGQENCDWWRFEDISIIVIIITRGEATSVTLLDSLRHFNVQDFLSNSVNVL